MSCIQALPGAAPCQRHRQATLDRARDTLGRLARKAGLWFTRYQTRRVLRDLDAHLLRDIGITRGQATREAAKPFWIE